ncbi:MAG TPA: hypothetical protein VML91_11765 [Burkholderiales bacterium]|nr:hypothetical protein [Burkholderiales bacterium]
MKTSRRLVLAALFVAMSTGLLGAACRGGLEDYEATQINEQQYPVEANASPQCISAAKRATNFCIGRKSMMDIDSHADCNDARWDYYRYCR